MRSLAAKTHLDGNRNKLSGAFAVPHDKLRKLLHKLRQAVPETHKRRRIARLVNLSLRRAPLLLLLLRGPIREQHDRIVRRHVPVDTDSVKRALHSIVERRLQCRGRDGRVRRDAPE